MRRVLVVGLAILVLVALDAVFNNWRISTAIYLELLEFGRLVNRTISGGR